MYYYIITEGMDSVSCFSTIESYKRKTNELDKMEKKYILIIGDGFTTVTINQKQGERMRRWT